MHAPLRAGRVTVFGRILREPLFHFLVIGLLLFALYGLVGGRADDRRIRVDDKVVERLVAQFQMSRQRPPTSVEKQMLVDSYVRDEIFYREGLAIGLDIDDPMIKRRVSQKFATIAEESEAAAMPADDDLQRWLDKHAARYAEPALITFDQVAFDSASADIESARRALASGANPQALGTSRMLLPHFDLYPMDAIDRDFGAGFANALLSVRPGRWEGPIRSGYGVHLVRVEKVVPGRTAKLSEVRAAVARDYEQDRRQQAADTAYRKLMREYRIDYPRGWRQPSAQ